MDDGERGGEAKHTVVVIGSGFGGTMTALSIGRAFKRRGKGETVHILERGTWWTTPVGTVQDLDVRTPKHLRDHGQPVQYWASADRTAGLLDIFGRCFKRPSNPDGLYDITEFGTAPTGLFARWRRALSGLKRSDGLRIVHASGVGGGSLVYSNVTIRPPEPLFGTAPWKTVTWDAEQRDAYYELARNAIGYGVLAALDRRDRVTESPATPINTGLSNIVARSAGLRPSQPQKNQPVPPDPRTDILHLDETKDNSFWIDRARVFQSTLRPVADECGTVDSSINDLPPASIPWGQIDAHPPDLAGPPAAKNYCQRQGRCTTGCLPGARQTLNKQLMRALFGAAPNDAQGHTPPGPAAPRISAAR